MGRIPESAPPLTDESLMPSGKHKGTKMIDVPAKYLLHVYENNMCTKQVKNYVKANLDVITTQANTEPDEEE
jgi:uncharacterized protein (DUF3820 family)